MRGRTPTPTGVKLLQGTHRPDRDGDVECESSAPEKPVYIAANSIANAEWDRVTEKLVDMGLLNRIDCAVLASYCQSVADLAAAVEAIETDGRWISTDEGIVAHPALKEKNQMMTQIRQFSALLGLNPAHRSRMRASVPPPPDEFDQLYS